jgi:hypothetical protein
MTGAWGIPIFHDLKNGTFYLAGFSGPYPPATWPTWSKRRPAIGAVIRPGQDLNIVFGLTRTSARAGRALGPVVDYVSERPYTLDYGLVVIISRKC